MKVVIFLGPPRGASGAQRKLRYQFGNYVSRPTGLLGVALFRWLCTEREIPEQVLIYGGARSDWDMMHELAAVDADMPEFASIRLREAINFGGVSRVELDKLQSFLKGFLGGVDVQCVLSPPAQGLGGQLKFFTGLDEHIKRGDELHVDVSQDFWACGLFGSAAAAFLAQGNHVNIGGIYLAEPAAADMVGTPVLMISQVNRLVEWSNAIAVFRQSGLLGRLPDLFREEIPLLADALTAINFSVLTYQYEGMYENFQLALSLVKAISSRPPRTLAEFFVNQLAREATWLKDIHVADWQLEFARRSLFSGDYMRAVSLSIEAVVSASIKRTRKRVERSHREHAVGYLRAERSRAQLYPVDPWPFLRLFELREVLAGVSSPNPELRRDILRSEKSLRQFLERSISFTAVLVARFKRTPPL